MAAFATAGTTTLKLSSYESWHESWHIKEHSTYDSMYKYFSVAIPYHSMGLVTSWFDPLPHWVSPHGKLLVSVRDCWVLDYVGRKSATHFKHLQHPPSIMAVQFGFLNFLHLRPQIALQEFVLINWIYMHAGCHSDQQNLLDECNQLHIPSTGVEMVTMFWNTF